MSQFTEPAAAISSEAVQLDPVTEFKDALTEHAKVGIQSSLIVLGLELGLFNVLMTEGPQSYKDLAAAVGMNARYCKEWCIAMAARPLLTYNAESGKFALPEVLFPAFKDESSFAMPQIMVAMLGSFDKLKASYKSGEGIGYGEHSCILTKGTKNFFQPLYENKLVPNLPASVVKTLTDGGSLADIGCGEGLTCFVLGSAFPKAKIVGYDYHLASINVAKFELEKKKLKNVSFVHRNASDINSDTVDLVTFFDCFHDMSVAGAAAKQAYDMLKPNGQVFLIEPLGPENDNITEQLALPTTPLYAACSCYVCLPCGMANGGDGLGAICATAQHRKLFTAAGFKSVETIRSPLNEDGFRLIIVQK